MEYYPLKTINPGYEDITVKSSIWLCSRLMPGRGNELVSFPHFRNIRNTGMRSALLTELRLAGLIGLTDNGTLVNLLAGVPSLIYRGLWTINELPIVGQATIANGLVAPFNTFNMGYRYRRGWRPVRVN